MNFFALQLLFFAFAYLTCLCGAHPRATKQCHCYAHLCFTVPLQGSASPDCAMPSQGRSELSIATAYQSIAMRFLAFLCRCRVSHSCSTPWLLIALPSHALAAPCLSRQCRCKAYRLDSELFLCRTRVFSALPLLHSSMRFLCAAPRLKAVP